MTSLLFHMGLRLSSKTTFLCYRELWSVQIPCHDFLPSRVAMKRSTLFSKCWELLSKPSSVLWVWFVLGPDKLHFERESAQNKIKFPRCWTINCSVSPCLSSPLRRQRRWDWPPPLTECISFSSNPCPGIRKFPTSKYQCWVLPTPDNQWEIM